MIIYNIAGLIGLILSALPAIVVYCIFPARLVAIEMSVLTWAASMASFSVLYDRTSPAAPGKPKSRAQGRAAIFGGPLLLAPFAVLALFGFLAVSGQIKPAPSLFFWIGLSVLGVLAIVVAGATEPYRRLPPNKPCPKCGKPLRSNQAKQCLECGATWRRKKDRSALPAAAAGATESSPSNLQPLLLGAGSLLFIPLLLIVANLIFGTRDPAAAGPSASTGHRPDATKAGQEPTAGSKVNAGKLAGAWEGITNNNQLREVWTITNKDGDCSVVCRYYRGADELGMFHSDKCWLEKGELHCSTVFDVAPLPGWFGCTWTVALIDADTIQANWRDRNGFTGGGRLVRK